MIAAMGRYDMNVRKDTAVIFDIDGTLADISHRLHHITGYVDNEANRIKKDWDAFNEDCLEDKIYQPIKEMLLLYFDSGHIVILVTGRNEKVRKKTEEWLNLHKIPFDQLHMRDSDNMESDYIVKQNIYREKILPYYNVKLVVEDRKAVVDMWRRNGLICLQCKEGDY